MGRLHVRGSERGRAVGEETVCDLTAGVEVVSIAKESLALELF